MDLVIVLDKNTGVWPIGVCETARCIVAKAVLSIAKADVLVASGFMQLCTGQPTGTEAIVHSMKESFEKDNTEAMLLIDSMNAFSCAGSTGMWLYETSDNHAPLLQPLWSTHIMTTLICLLKAQS